MALTIAVFELAAEPTIGTPTPVTVVAEDVPSDAPELTYSLDCGIGEPPQADDEPRWLADGIVVAGEMTSVTVPDGVLAPGMGYE